MGGAVGLPLIALQSIFWDFVCNRSRVRADHIDLNHATATGSQGSARNRQLRIACIRYHHARRAGGAGVGRWGNLHPIECAA